MTERKRVAVLDAALKAMFRALEGRQVPRHLRETVEDLERSSREREPERRRA